MKRICLGLALFTCVVTPLSWAQAEEAEGPAFAEVTIELQRGEIEIEYRLASAVARLDLARDTTQYRSSSWRILTPGITLQGSALLATDGKSFDRVRISVSALERSAEKDYDPVLRFSDGGRAVYTGQFDVAGQHGATAFEFPATKKMPVVLSGVLHRTAVGYKPQWLGDGTYAYFGRTPLLELPFGLAIIDPSLPAWALAELRTAMPALVAYYGERLGPSPASHPFIIFNYEPGRGAGTGNGGDVLPGLVRLVLYGAGWQDDSPKLRHRLRWVIAHEVAHFWNSQTHDEAAPWMHEGSADALAHLALHDLGFITQDELMQAQDGALNRCLMELDGRSINEGHYRTAYDCGHMMALLTDAAMLKSAPGSGLHRFWRTLLQLVGKDGYTQGHYVANLAQQTGEARTAVRIYDFANRPLPALAEALTLAFAEAGRPIVPAHGEPALDVSRALYRRLLGHLMAQDCRGHKSFDTFEDRVVLNGSAECVVLKGMFSVKKLAGFPVYQSALAAYTAVAALCAKHATVTLEGATPAETAALPCTTSMPRVPRLMTFKSATGAASQ